MPKKIIGHGRLFERREYVSMCNCCQSNSVNDCDSYLGMLGKWKTIIIAWFSVFQMQFEVFIDG